MLITAIGIAVFLIITFASSIHGIGLLLFLMIIHGTLVTFFGESATHLPFYCALAVAAAIFGQGSWKFFKFNHAIIFISLVLIMALSSAFGINQGNSLDNLLLYGKGFVLALLVAGTIRSLNDYKIVSAYCLIGGLIGATMALYQYKTGTYYISSIYEQRAAGLRGDPNDTAALLVACLPFSVYWLVTVRRLPLKILLTFGTLSLIAGLALTASRGGMVALAMVSAVFLFKHPRPSAFIGITIAALFILAAAPQQMWNRFESIWTGDVQHGASSFRGRLELLNDGANILLEHPLLGVGVGNFPAARQRLGSAHGTPLIGTEKSSHVAHNLYLEFFAETGFLGGSLLIVLLLICLKGLSKLSRNSESDRFFNISDAFYFSLLALLFSGLFLSQGKSSVLWFIIGIALSAWTLNKPVTPPLAYPRVQLRK